MCCLPPSWNPLPGGLGELLTPGREEWGQSSTEEALPGDAPTLHTPDARMPRGAQNGPALGADGRQQGRGGGRQREGLTFRFRFLILHCWLLKAQ